jgi:hypothetical protein
MATYRYFDAVLDKKDRRPIFNGTPEEVKAWLLENKNNPLLKSADICRGKTLAFTSIENYLKQ